jgi:hypothetical protein
MMQFQKQCRLHRAFKIYHPTIGFLYVPNSFTKVPWGEQGPFFVRANKQGFRSNFDFCEKKKSDKDKRIVFLGDSYTDGSGVEAEKRFSNLFARSFKRLECYNFGLEEGILWETRKKMI